MNDQTANLLHISLLVSFCDARVFNLSSPNKDQRISSLQRHKKEWNQTSSKYPRRGKIPTIYQLQGIQNMLVFYTSKRNRISHISIISAIVKFQLMSNFNILSILGYFCYRTSLANYRTGLSLHHASPVGKSMTPSVQIHRRPSVFSCWICSGGRDGGDQSDPVISPSTSSTTYSCGNK